MDKQLNEKVFLLSEKGVILVEKDKLAEFQMQTKIDKIKEQIDEVNQYISGRGHRNKNLIQFAKIFGQEYSRELGLGLLVGLGAKVDVDWSDFALFN